MVAVPDSIRRTERVFLIGPMGAGKTTIGRSLAVMLGWEFFDCDHLIEARTGASIPLIFELEGEAGFRKREAAVIDELSQRERVVVATGGGAVLLAENRQALKQRGTVVYLHAALDTLVTRTARDRNRPLLQQGDRRKTLEDLMRVREPLYRETADIVIETSRRPPQTVAREILKQLTGLGFHENAHA